MFGNWHQGQRWRLHFCHTTKTNCQIRTRLLRRSDGKSQDQVRKNNYVVQLRIIIYNLAYIAYRFDNFTLFGAQTIHDNCTNS